MPEIVRLKLKISGRVQGVNFRYFLLEKARELGITGWARNEANGSVLVLAEGSKESLEKLVRYCQRGPEFAKVERVQSEWGKASGTLENFVIK